MPVYGDPELAAWFVDEYGKSGKKQNGIATNQLQGTVVAVLGERGSCSGTVIGKPRCVLTAAHFLPATEVHFDARLPEVPLPARLRARGIAARAIGSWSPSTRDLAVLRPAPFQLYRWLKLHGLDPTPFRVTGDEDERGG